MKTKLAISAVFLLAGCASFGTPHDEFVNRMYACAQKHECQPFQLDSVLAGADPGITVVPVMKQEKFNGADGYVHLQSSTITLKVLPSAARMISALNHELDHINGKRHPNDTTGPVYDQRKVNLERERSFAIERMNMPDYGR